LFLTLSAVVVSKSHSAVLRRISLASEAEKELQERWAITSIRATLLHSTEWARGFAPTQNQGTATTWSEKRSNRKWSGHVILSGLRYNVTVFDENAKIPVALILTGRNELSNRNALSKLTTNAGRLKLPTPKSVTQLKELFDTDETITPNDRFQSLLQAAEHLTTSSDGKINFWTTSDTAIDTLWNWRFGTNAPQTLHDRENLNRDLPLSALLATLGLTNTDQQFALSVFSQESNAYSAWIEQKRGNGTTGFCGFYVSRTSRGYADNHFGFHWP
jgi:hypothetical protein